MRSQAGVAITVQGRYIPPSMITTGLERKLYFEIVGTAASVQMAKSMLRTMLTDAEKRMKLMGKGDR